MMTLMLGLMGTQLQAQEMYARGDFNEWGTWHAMELIDSTDLIWEAKSVYLSADTIEMKFANTADWSGDDWGGGSGLSDTVSLTTGGGPNISMIVTDAGFYDLVFNQTDLSYTFTLTPHNAEETLMYARGSFNDWGTGNRMYLIGDHQWKTTVTLEANGYTMKFANHPDWIGDDWGDASGLSGTAALSTGGGPDLAFVIADAGDYDILFNDSSLAYVIEPAGTSTSLLDQQAILHLRAYPNPAQDILLVEWEQTDRAAVQVQLLNLQGQVLQQQDLPRTLAAQQVRLDLRTLSRGTYLLKVGQASRLIVKQ